MPDSNPATRPFVQGYMKSLHREIKTVLDIGVGIGTYGKLAYEALNDGVHITGVEAETSYITRYADKLNTYYDELLNMSAQSLLDDVDKCYDLVTLGDVIEHMPKSDGVDLLDFLQYRAKWLIIVYPLQSIQNSVGGVACEAHVSVWSLQDFLRYDVRYFRQIGSGRGAKQMIVLRGYR